MLKCLLTGVLLASGSALAASETVGLLSFSPPEGWARSANKSQVAFERVDQAKGTFCRVSVSFPVPSTGSAEGDFRAEWQDWVVGNMQVLAPPRPTAGQTSARLAFIEGRADVLNQGAPFHYRVFVFSVAGQRQTVQLVAGKAAQVDACRTGPLEAFFSSLRSGGSAPAAVAAAPPPKPADGPTGVGSWRGDRPRGVYMAYGSDSSSAFITAPQPQWLVLFDDGASRSVMPSEGLAAFDRGESLRKGEIGWGRWSWDGSAGAVVTLGSGSKTSLKEHRQGLVVDSTVYTRLAPVDGLRLEGAWTSYANPEDPSLATQPVGQRPLIRFTRAGRFTDEGLLQVLASLVNETGAPAPGGGTYSVKDFTLTLRYDSGRVVTRNFHGFLGADPAKADGRLLLGRWLLNKTRY